ncbi:MAG: FABP family protein [bacterium]|nr:FABP family protein [bacterium]
MRPETAHPSGIAEIRAGTVGDRSIRMRATTVDSTPTATDVPSLTRTIGVIASEMHYVIEMAAVGHDLPFHVGQDRAHFQNVQ